MPIEPLGAFRAVLANPQLRRLQFAWISSTLGVWAFDVAILIYAYRTGGAPLVGVMTVVRMLPAALAGPLIGAVTDRSRRRRVMVVAEGARASGVAAVAVTVAIGLPAVVVFVLMAVVTIAQATVKPAQAALLPGLARTPAELSASNVAWTSTDNAGFLVGSAVGGVLVAATSVEAVGAMTAALLATSATLMVGIPLDDARATTGDGTRRPGLASAFAGAGAIMRDARQRLIVTLFAALTFVEGASDVLIVVVAIELLDLGQPGVGWLSAAWGAGGLLGAVGLGALGSRGLAAGLSIGALVLGSALVLVGIVPLSAPVLSFFVAAGAGYALVEVAGLTLLQRLSADDVLARTFGTLESVSMGMFALGGLTAPVVLWLVGIEGTLIAFGALLPLLALARWSRLRSFEAGAQVPVREYELLRGLPIFRPLPLATVEMLARSMERVERDTGAAVITEGEVGDRYYVIDEGEVEIFQGGELKQVQGPGEAFGEIALLRDIPRTATVRARTPVLLHCLDRDQFIPVVTGHAGSAQAANAVVGRWLGGARVKQ